MAMGLPYQLSIKNFLIIILGLSLGTSIYGWHEDHQKMVNLYVSSQKENKEQLANANDLENTYIHQIAILREEKDKITTSSKQLVLAYLDQLQKNDQLADAAESYIKSTEELQKRNTVLSMQNPTPLVTQPSVIYVPVSQQIPNGVQIPPSTLTTGTIMHPDGTMSQIFLDTQ